MDAQFREHAELPRLVPAIRRLYAEERWVGFDGTVFRAAHPRYAELPDLVSGAGALRKGSRWIAPGLTKVLHTAMTPEGALAEAMAVRRKYGLPDQAALPLVLRGIRARMGRVLNLCDGGIRVSLRVSHERMVAGDWEAENRAGRGVVTQAIGRAAAMAGFEGLVVPSAIEPTARNLVVFMDRLGTRSGVTLDEAD